jgi:chemotaxis protein methyltransferase CheR
MNAPITPAEVTLWSRYIQDACGIVLDQSKAYLLEARLGSLLRETAANGYSELFYKVKGDSSNTLRGKIVDAITTNETSFFRDTSPFELLQHKVLPELIDRRGKTGSRPIPIRIWSAACSTGQEIYTIGIVLKTMLGSLSGYDIRMLGTDISNRAVAAASRGYFSDLEIGRGLPASAAKYFTKDVNGWKIADEIRAMASFRKMNLLEAFSFPQPFDIILCRNVGIYFAEPDRGRMFHNFARCLARDGSLIIGSTESIGGLCPAFVSQRYLRTVFYALQS